MGHANIGVAWLFALCYSVALVFASTWMVVTWAPQVASDHTLSHVAQHETLNLYCVTQHGTGVLCIYIAAWVSRVHVHARFTLHVSEVSTFVVSTETVSIHKPIVVCLGGAGCWRGRRGGHGLPQRLHAAPRAPAVPPPPLVYRMPGQNSCCVFSQYAVLVTGSCKETSQSQIAIIELNLQCGDLLGGGWALPEKGSRAGAWCELTALWYSCLRWSSSDTLSCLVQVFNVQTLLVKFASCAAAVGSGLPVGPEGPMVHIGAMVGLPRAEGGC